MVFHRDADLVFDVRFLPNPYYIEELRAKTGNEAEVRDYVMKSDKAQEFFRQLSQMMDFLIPNYILEGKNQLVVAVGCTGGKHRSVTLANALYQYLEVRENYGVRIEHRDTEGCHQKGKIAGIHDVIFRKSKRRAFAAVEQRKTLSDCRNCSLDRDVRGSDDQQF